MVTDNQFAAGKKTAGGRVLMTTADSTEQASSQLSGMAAPIAMHCLERPCRYGSTPLQLGQVTNLFLFTDHTYTGIISCQTLRPS